MCGRFTLTQSSEAVAAQFQLAEVPQFVPGYNIAPTQPVPVIRINPATEPSQNQPVARQFSYLYWGLIPSWSKDPTLGSRLINARAETVAEKPSFRAAFKRRRCLVVADGFYEWKPLSAESASVRSGTKSGTKSKTKSGIQKQPFYFYLNHHQPFGFAGLWESWHSPSGDQIESCTILTTIANEIMQPIHDRMPVILEARDYDRWLDPSVESSKLLSLLRPYPDQQMSVHPVSPQVNSPRYDSPDCITPL